MYDFLHTKKSKQYEYKVATFLRESNAIEDEWDETSYIQARKAWDFIVKEDKLTLPVILKTHNLLMRYHLSKEDRGHLRTCPIYIGGREGKPWYALQPLLESWMEIANQIDKLDGITDLEEVIKHDHVQYETIHPFIDGNGRTGRIFMNWQRVKCGLDPLVIWQREKYSYYEWFQGQGR